MNRLQTSLSRCLLKVLVSVIFIFIFTNNHTEAIRLHSDGGYDIVIGVENNTPEPKNVKQFMAEIREGIDRFSTELWKATKRRFYIRSVDVLVPGNWWTLSDFEPASWQTVHNSEIRIAHDVAAPNVVNPNPCGTSGLYMEIPDDFFQMPGDPEGQYGPIGKALVNLWARYRFGVWEEHGIPGDTKFPYFYTRPSYDHKWEATGCNNEKLTGTFRTISGEESERCDPTSSKSPDDDCRLIPFPSNTANSSLMHFHWLDSVTEFCDSKTHNHGAPNRQNLFCGHRSIWEVIRQSDDYKSTKICRDEVPQPNFRALKETRTPEFYILLDKGLTVTPEKVLKELMGAVVNLVSTPSIEKLNIAVGTFPHSNHYDVKEEVEWAPIQSVIYDVERILSESVDPEGPVIRDFGLAIQKVSEKIKQRNHLAGTVLLVIKRGAAPNAFEKISFEQEVIASIKEDGRIKVFAVELQQGEQTPYTNLESLVEQTNGMYHLINDTMHTAKKIEGFLSAMQEILEQSSIMNGMNSWVIQKQYTTPNTPIEIPIYDNVNTVKVHLTTNNKILQRDITLDQLDGDHKFTEVIEKAEWNENNDLTKRLVFTYIIRNPKQGSKWTLKHNCDTDKPTDCEFFLIVTAQNEVFTPQFSPKDIGFSSKLITIDISTSAEYNFVDMSQIGFRMVPFAIFAKIEMDQQRVLGLENVTALVRLRGDHESHIGHWEIPLLDDGKGQPDISARDGIYSAAFTPTEDGLYQISVSASGESGVGIGFQDMRIVNHAGSLMPRDQMNIGCKNSSKRRCSSAVPRGSFSRVQDMAEIVTVENSATFKPGKPMKILDFAVAVLPGFVVEFSFTSPPLFASTDSADEFRFYMAPHIDNFLDSTDLTPHLMTEIGSPPGTRVVLKYHAFESAIPYYAVEAIYQGQRSGPSNVVGVLTGPEMLPPALPLISSDIPEETTPDIEEIQTTSTSTTTDNPTTPVWETTTKTTVSPYSTTTEESEESDEETTTTTELASTSTTPALLVPAFSSSTPVPSSSSVLPMFDMSESETSTVSPLVIRESREAIEELEIEFMSVTEADLDATTTAPTQTEITSTSAEVIIAGVTEDYSTTTASPQLANADLSNEAEDTTAIDDESSTTPESSLLESSAEIPISDDAPAIIICSSSTSTTPEPIIESILISTTSTPATSTSTSTTTEDLGITSTTPETMMDLFSTSTTEDSLNAPIVIAGTISTSTTTTAEPIMELLETTTEEETEDSLILENIIEAISSTSTTPEPEVVELPVIFEDDVMSEESSSIAPLTSSSSSTTMEPPSSSPTPAITPPTPTPETPSASASTLELETSTSNPTTTTTDASSLKASTPESQSQEDSTPEPSSSSLSTGGAGGGGGGGSPEEAIVSFSNTLVTSERLLISLALFSIFYQRVAAG